jgi:hypothetical protein
VDLAVEDENRSGMNSRGGESENTVDLGNPGLGLELVEETELGQL